MNEPCFSPARVGSDGVGPLRKGGRPGVPWKEREGGHHRRRRRRRARVHSFAGVRPGGGGGGGLVRAAEAPAHPQLTTQAIHNALPAREGCPPPPPKRQAGSQCRPRLPQRPGPKRPSRTLKPTIRWPLTEPKPEATSERASETPPARRKSGGMAAPPPCAPSCCDVGQRGRGRRAPLTRRVGRARELAPVDPRPDPTRPPNASCELAKGKEKAGQAGSCPPLNFSSWVRSQHAWLAWRARVGDVFEKGDGNRGGHACRLVRE